MMKSSSHDPDASFLETALGVAEGLEQTWPVAQTGYLYSKALVLALAGTFLASHEIEFGDSDHQIEQELASDKAAVACACQELGSQRASEVESCEALLKLGSPS